MKLSTSWVKQSLGRTISDRELSNAIEHAGIEVEQLISSKKFDPMIVVGKVKKCVQHPNADRLRVCEVELPSGIVQIVCGAPNVREGLSVAVAQVGATLPDGDTITKAKLRGEVSEGMLCSGRELGLNDDHDGLIELDDNLDVGTPLGQFYPPDGQIEVKTAANRPDLQCTVGIANEIAAVLELPVVLPKVISLNEMNIGSRLGAVETPHVRKLMLAELELGESKNDLLSTYITWLRTSTIRSISPVVDIINIAMLECGQPLHAYDADKVRGAIGVRMAKAGETLVTLDGVSRKLSPEDIVIVDDRGPIALGGVMGGLGTEVDETTKRIYVEAATFDGATVRKTSKRHGLRSEASARIERGLHTQMAVNSLGRTISLLQEVCDAKVISLSVIGSDDVPAPLVTLPFGRLTRLVRSAISVSEATTALERLQYKVTSADNMLTATPPWWRTDVSMSEDLIEDIVRIIGYDRIPATFPLWQPESITFDGNRSWRRRINSVLSGVGLFEVHTYSFVSREQIELLGEQAEAYLELENPLSKEQAFLRRSPLPSLLQTLVKNEGYAPAFGVYEVTGVFEAGAKGELPSEPERLAVIWQAKAGAYTSLKGMYDAVCSALQLDLMITARDAATMAPGRSGVVTLAGTEIGVIGQLAPATVRAHRLNGEIAYFELDMAALLMAAKNHEYMAPSRFPVARRDLAIVVSRDVTWEQIRSAVLQTSDAEVTFLNDYYGDDLTEGSKSLAMRLAMSAVDHTLTDAEVADRMKRIERALAKAFGAQVR